MELLPLLLLVVRPAKASNDCETRILVRSRRGVSKELVSTLDVAEIKNQLLSSERVKIDNFIDALNQPFSRRVQGVNVTVLHGFSQQIATIEQAIE